MDALKIFVLAATAATLLPINLVYGDQSLRGPPSAADHLPTERELIIGGQDAKEKNDYGFFGTFGFLSPSLVLILCKNYF